MICDQIGRNMKRLRQERGMTQSNLADLLCVSHQMISRYENGTVVPDIGMLVKMCDLFRVSLDHLCGLDERAKETLICRIMEQYSEKQSSSYSLLEEGYLKFLEEAESVMGDDRILNIQLLLLENMHDNIETREQMRAVNERIFECAAHILDVSRNDSLRSFANYRMAIYYGETEFHSTEYVKNLALARSYANKVLLCTYFPEYIPTMGVDIRSAEYKEALKSNVRFFAQKLQQTIEKLNRVGAEDGEGAEYVKLAEVFGEIVN